MTLTVTFIDDLGEVVQVASVPDQNHIDINIPEGGSYLEGAPPENSYRIDGAWVEKPVIPTRAHQWDRVAKQWFDPRTLSQVKASQWSAIKLSRQTAIEAPIVTPYGTFDADERSQKAITDAVLMLQTLESLGTPTTIDFTLANNSTVTLTTAQMVTVGLMLGQQTQAAFAKGRLLREAIDAATTTAAVEAVVW